MWCIVPAAGIGSRMQSEVPKQYLKLHNNKTILDTTIEKLLRSDVIKNIMVVLHPKDQHWTHSIYVKHQHVQICIGGKNRVDSVFNALQSLKKKVKNEQWVMVHDAARACVSSDDVDALYHMVEVTESVGGILALPVYETVKQADMFDNIVKTVDRSDLWLAQTPQMFSYEILIKSVHKALQDNVVITDEASAVEYAGFKPILMEGRRSNIKITVSEDIEFANQCLKIQK
jgi:2-C-methyl-D-erythritol 4-phosphate cytidylyltransferase